MATQKIETTEMSDNDSILLHDDISLKNVYALSNNDGIFLCSPSESLMKKILFFLKITLPRINDLDSSNDETILNEIETIQNEINFFNDLKK